MIQMAITVRTEPLGFLWVKKRTELHFIPLETIEDFRSSASKLNIDSERFHSKENRKRYGLKEI